MSGKCIRTMSALALGAVLGTVPMAATAKSDGWRADQGQRMERMMDRAEQGPRFDFAKADADGDGKVTQEELAALRAAEIAALDADGDGFVSAEELAGRMRAARDERMARLAGRQLERLDADGDGKVAVTELPEGPLGRFFAAIDADGDGAVTEAEIAAAAEAFEALRDSRAAGREPGEARSLPWMRDRN